MILCDLCGQARECEQKEIEGKEYDICTECWKPLAEKLKGKGRARKERETVFLPHLPKELEPPGPKSTPLKEDERACPHTCFRPTDTAFALAPC
jgi:ribosome-binding protein aMBF1 (putative translation factor)